MFVDRLYSINYIRIALVLLLVLFSGCATIGASHDTDNSDWGNLERTAPATNANDTTSVADIDSVFHRGTSAYRNGDLDKAEAHFRAVLQRNPRHSRATYNLSMIYLQRAYDGLQHYARIEPESQRSDRARYLVKQLDTLGTAK